MSKSKPRHVGEAIRKLRENINMSVRTLASKCGFSPSFISQVENGQSSPSIASLERIAAALSVTLVQFFQSTEAEAPAIIKASRRSALSSGWSRAKLELLSSDSERSRLNPVLVTLAPDGASSKTPVSHPNQQFAMVFEGTILLTLEHTSEVLQRGDAVTIPSGTRYRWHNTSSKPAQILLVFTSLTP
jgi:XRE family transcriptional regulator, regulator of sulfur utilization